MSSLQTSKERAVTPCKLSSFPTFHWQVCPKQIRNILCREDKTAQLIKNTLLNNILSPGDLYNIDSFFPPVKKRLLLHCRVIHYHLDCVLQSNAKAKLTYSLFRQVDPDKMVPRGLGKGSDQAGFAHSR